MTARYMLDTDTVSYALRGQGHIKERILKHRPSEICISSITLGELRYGAERRNSQKLHELISAFSANILVMPFDDTCADHFGRIASELARRGSPIGDFDALIAAHASALGVTLVTNNLKHFSRVPQLAVENWL
jgi:tRNA(fMet)-specific endonuclease VapC